MGNIFKKFIEWLSGSSKSACNESKVRGVVEEILKELGIMRKIDSVTFRPKNDWYIVRFYSPPS